MNRQTWIGIAIFVALVVAWKLARGQWALSRAAAGMTGDFVVLDVRTPEEYRQGHYQGALNIPVQELPNRMAEVGDPSAPVIVYCHSGGRAAIAAHRLRQAGYTRVFNVQSLANMHKAGRLAGR